MLLLLSALALAQCYTGTVLREKHAFTVEVTSPHRKTCIKCPWRIRALADTAGDPVAAQALWEAMVKPHRTCIGGLLRLDSQLVTSRNQANESLVFFARSVEVMEELLRFNVDIEAKKQAGVHQDSSPLVHYLLDNSTIARRLLSAGAAVCTLPINPFNIPLVNCKYICEGRCCVPAWVVSKALKAPCEPGYYLRKMPGCDGLTPCEHGYYCPGYRKKMNERVTCPAGTYGPHAGAASEHDCRPCPFHRPHSMPGSVSPAECFGEELPVAQLASPV